MQQIQHETCNEELTRVYVLLLLIEAAFPRILTTVYCRHGIMQFGFRYYNPQIERAFTRYLAHLLKFTDLNVDRYFPKIGGVVMSIHLMHFPRPIQERLRFSAAISDSGDEELEHPCIPKLRRVISGEIGKLNVTSNLPTLGARWEAE